MPRAKNPASAAKSPSESGERPVLLSGGNPQIAKGEGEGPVLAYIEAMPGWKRDIGQALHDLIARNVPDLRMAVMWNTPFYGVDGKGFFLGFHCLAKCVRVAFFRGTSLDPLPPGESKQKEVRYLDIREGDAIDEGLVAAWIRQAAALPGFMS